MNLENRELEWLVAACDLVVKQVGLQAAQPALAIAAKLQAELTARNQPKEVKNDDV